jgi:hemerythrin
MEWRKEYEIGVERIDEQHRELFRRVGRLVEAFRAGKRAEVGATLAFLRTYVVEHFSAEQAEMVAAGYPEAAAHASAHARFVGDLVTLESRHDHDPSSPWLATSLTIDLARWLRDHILGMDQKLGEFLRSRA